MQRGEDIDIMGEGQFHLKIVRISPPQGQGQHKRQSTQLDKMRRIKRSIVRITNTDELCLARAIAVVVARIFIADSKISACLTSLHCTCRKRQPKSSWNKPAWKITKVAVVSQSWRNCNSPCQNTKSGSLAAWPPVAWSTQGHQRPTSSTSIITTTTMTWLRNCPAFLIVATTATRAIHHTVTGISTSARQFVLAATKDHHVKTDS